VHDPPLSRRVQEPHPNPSVLPPWRGRCLLVFTQVDPSTNLDCTRLRYRLDEEAGFAGDYSRVKSFAWGTPLGDNHNKMLPTHTLNSKQWVGPLALMSGDRIIRGGRGSVGCGISIHSRYMDHQARIRLAGTSTPKIRGETIPRRLRSLGAALHD
jgi:hypothetical protein